MAHKSNFLNWPDQLLVAERIYNYFISHGLHHEASCAMVTMAEAESSFRHDALGDHDKAYGLWQLHEDRCIVVDDGCSVDLRLYPPVAKQCEAILWELINVPFEHKAYLLFNEDGIDAYTAGYRATKHYERPSAPGQAERRGQRNVWWSDYFKNLFRSNV